MRHALNLAALRDEILQPSFKPGFASRLSREVKFYLSYGGTGGTLKFHALNLAQNIGLLKISL
nr:hypothetical protein [uncultured Campylobacter sp.]